MMSFIGFAVGFVFFGQPLIRRGIRLLTQKIPDWKTYLELRRYACALIYSSLLLITVP
jgi:hypothetical protein